MRSVRPVPISELDFSPYGQYCNLRDEPWMEKDGLFQAFRSRSAVVSRPLKLGITRIGESGNFRCRKMERHISTEELLFPGDKPLIMAVANSDPEGLPREEDIVVVKFRPGDLVILNKGIWHDACRAEEGETYYYFMANNDGNPRETEWVPVHPAPVQVLVK